VNLDDTIVAIATPPGRGGIGVVRIAGTIINPYRSQAPATINVYARDVLNGYPAGVTGVAR